MFHKEGHKIVMISIALVVIAIMSIDYFVTTAWLRTSLMLIVVAFFIIVLQFFRNPKRIGTLHDDHVLSPVDGKVVVIEEVFEKEFFKDKRIQISIFMSPINVHVTRYPIGGKVIYSKYHTGKYLVAWHPKASEENERTTVVVENNTFGQVLYRQVAGAMAKRIVNYAIVNNEIEQGADSGFIKFGSRVDLYLPLDANIKVALNQKVKGGVSLIAEKK